MAIAFDLGTGILPTNGSTTITQAHTCTGSDLILVVQFSDNNASDIVTGITYNGVSMTRSQFYTTVGRTGRMYTYYLINPATGSNNVVVSTNIGVSGSVLCINSFTGAKQSGQPDAVGTNRTSGSTSSNVAVTTVADNCWLVGMSWDDFGNSSASTATTRRASAGASFGQQSWSSSSAQTPAGSKTLNITNASSIDTDWVAISISPSVAAVDADQGIFTQKPQPLANVYSRVVELMPY